MQFTFEMARARWGIALVLLHVGFVQLPQVSGQEAVPIPPAPALPAPPKAVASAKPIASIAEPIVPHAPTLLQTLASARRGFCAHLRSSPIGKLAAEMHGPLSTFTGGLVPAEKPPHPDEQAQPGPEGTAAQIKTVALQAPRRQAAVAELKGLDIRYFPEAEATLIAALRVDPSECVRLEAAKTIASLPVCSKAIAKALTLCINSSDADGNPAELSNAVRLQASVALCNCGCSPESGSGEQERPEYPSSGVAQAAAFLPSRSEAPLRLPITTELPNLVDEPISTGRVQAMQPPAAPERITVPPLLVDRPAAVPLPEIAKQAGSAPQAKPVPKSPQNLLEVFRSAAQ